jgi:hypothetical protein
VGDLLYGSAATAYSNLADVGVGAFLLSGGVTTAPKWSTLNNTVDSTNSALIQEGTAATNGTSTSGVPNQVLLKINTLATSTQSPLSVFSRGAHVFSVSPSTQQILATAGSAAAPAYSFAGSTSDGIYQSGGGAIRFAVSGSQAALIAQNYMLVQPGTGTPAYGLSDINNSTTGLAWPGANALSIFDSTDGEWVRWISRVMQVVRGSADTVSYALNSRKSRGSVAAPTVITTGDDLFTINSAGYVGNTNLFVNAAKIRARSAGTISDATTGIGGEVILSTSKQGVDTAPADRYKVDQFGHFVSLIGTANTPTMGACGTSPSVIGTDDAMTVTVGTGGAATSCAVNFGTAYVTNPPSCIAQNNTDRVAYNITTAIGSVTITAAAAFTASSKFNILCKGFL